MAVAVDQAPPTTGVDELEVFCRFCSALVLETGARLVIEDFQRVVLADHFGGATEMLVILPKKNGKTTTLAALGDLPPPDDARCRVRHGRHLPGSGDDPAGPGGRVRAAHPGPGRPHRHAARLPRVAQPGRHRPAAGAGGGRRHRRRSHPDVGAARRAAPAPVGGPVRRVPGWPRATSRAHGRDQHRRRLRDVAAGSDARSTLGSSRTCGASGPTPAAESAGRLLRAARVDAGIRTTTATTWPWSRWPTRRAGRPSRRCASATTPRRPRRRSGPGSRAGSGWPARRGGCTADVWRGAGDDRRAAARRRDHPRLRRVAVRGRHGPRWRAGSRTAWCSRSGCGSADRRRVGGAGRRRRRAHGGDDGALPGGARLLRPAAVAVRDRALGARVRRRRGAALLHESGPDDGGPRSGSAPTSWPARRRHTGDATLTRHVLSAQIREVRGGYWLTKTRPGSRRTRSTPRWRPCSRTRRAPMPWRPASRPGPSTPRPPSEEDCDAARDVQPGTPADPCRPRGGARPGQAGAVYGPDRRPAAGPAGGAARADPGDVRLVLRGAGRRRSTSSTPGMRPLSRLRDHRPVGLGPADRRHHRRAAGGVRLPDPRPRPVGGGQRLAGAAGQRHRR